MSNDEMNPGNETQFSSVEWPVAGLGIIYILVSYRKLIHNE
jgi:hypothetical protein